MTGERDLGIRAGRAMDDRVIGDIHGAAWTAGFADLFEAAFLGRLVARRRTMWTAMFETSRMRRTTVLLAERASEPVAFVHFGPAGIWDGQERTGQGEIYGLYAHPSAWGTGAAGRLIAAALTALAKSDLESIILWTLKGASRARRFYAKSGFTPTGRERAVDFGDGQSHMEIEYRLRSGTEDV